MAQFQFDASEFIAPTRSFDPLPAGRYEAMVVDSAVKDTKKGDGQYVEIVMDILTDSHSGRKLWDRLNISNPNKQAEDIGRGALAELCLAVGVQKLTETEQLHDVPVIIDVQIDRKDPSRNRVMRYLSAQARGNAPAPAGSAQAQSEVKQATRRPWSK